MGIQPPLPATLRAGVPVVSQAPDDYIQDLVRYFSETHKRVKEIGERNLAAQEGRDKGRKDGHLKVGDLVIRRKPRSQRPRGLHRFEWRADQHIYRVKAVLGDNTYELESILGVQAPGASRAVNRHPGDLLVKLDMPELQSDLANNFPKRLEVLDDR